MTDAVAAITALRASATRRVFYNKLVAGFVADITDSATAAGFVGVQGAWPSSMASGQYLTAFITSSSDPDRYEIIRITNTLSGVLTMQRGVEGTAALAWTAVDALVVADITADALFKVAQTDEPTVFAHPVAFEAGAAFDGAVDFATPVRFGDGVSLTVSESAAALVSTKAASIASPAFSVNGLGFPASSAPLEGSSLVVRNAQIVGEPRSFYLGAFSSAPTVVGSPLPAGSAYYDLSKMAMRVWTGLQWRETHALSIGAGSVFVYTLTAGDTEIDLTDADDNGETYSAVSGYFADIFKDGMLLVPNTGSGGDYTLNISTGLITFMSSYPSSAQILVRAAVAPSTLSPALAVARSLILDVPNGTRTDYALQISTTSDPVTVDPPSADDVYLYLDGVRQQPGVDYTLALGVVSFSTAPATGSTLWGQVFVAGTGT